MFESFGEVISIESVTKALLQSSQTNTKNANSKCAIMHEAYVTFKHSDDAYKAIKCQNLPKTINKLVPADTWHQPDYKTANQMPLNINFKCNHKYGADTINCTFDELFAFDGEKLICEHTVIQFELNLKSGVKMADIRRKLIHIKPYIGHLKLNLCIGFDDAHNDCIDNYDFQQRVMEVIGKHATGPKLYELTMNGFGRITLAMLNCLSPLLKPLNDLTINTTYCSILYLIQKFCPKLKVLHLTGRNSEGDDGKDEPVRAWPSLIWFVCNCVPFNADSDTNCGKRLRSFFTQNPQLEIIELNFMVENSLLKVIAKVLRNLKTLTVSRESFDGFGGIIHHVIRLKRLESIMITTWSFKTCHFKSLLACAECLSNMKRLKMATLMQNYVIDEDNPIILEAFPVIYHHECNCHNNNQRVLTFGDYIDAINLPENKQTIAILVAVQQDLKTTDDTLETRIFHMFKGATKFYPNVHKTTIIKDNDRFVFIHVASTH